MSTARIDRAPSFRLSGTDGVEHTLESYGDAAVLVLVQSCNHCPYVQAWEGRIKAIQADYTDRGVVLVAINSKEIVASSCITNPHRRRAVKKEATNATAATTGAP